MSGCILERKFICMPKELHAEFMSMQGTSMPRAAATAEDSAGATLSAVEVPATTMPMSPGVSDARLSAICAARAAICALV